MKAPSTAHSRRHRLEAHTLTRVPSHLQVGGKMPYAVFHYMFHKSVVPRTPIVIDLGRMHLRPGATDVPVHRQEGDGRRPTRDGRTVVCKTHPMFAAHPGTVELELQVHW